MRRISVIGIGVGNPGDLTRDAISALRTLDVVFVPDKGDAKQDLKEARLAICADVVDAARTRIVEFPVPERDRSPANYGSTVDDWHARLAALYADAFQRELREGQRGGFLVWGDPSLYDSTLRILERVRADDLALDIDVIPGITAVQALCARHRIVLNEIAEPVLITTGRRLARDWIAHTGNVIVMLDGQTAFTSLPAEEIEIFWGAYLGTPDEILVAGPLANVMDDIVARRTEARARKGWIMDIYLLRRGASRASR